MNESVLDYPVEDLDKGVWQKDALGTYTLTDDAKDKIFNLIRWAVSEIGLVKYGVNITGSITSNTYSPTSDIDIHINSKEISSEMQDEVNKKLRKRFEDEFKKENEYKIGEHPLEVYFQINPYQDMMSIGCYDVLNGKWIVGPEIKPMDYDPYSEFYEDDMKYIEQVIVQIRNVILQCLETATVIKTSKSFKFKEFESSRLIELIKRASDIFTSARNARKVYSTPRSKEDALLKRNSKKWKIADSSFKLLDKFGYLNILRELTKIKEETNSVDYDINELSNRVIQVIKDGFSKAQLNESDRMVISDFVEEGLGAAFSKVALMASLIAIPGLTDNQVLADELKDIPKTQLTTDNGKVNMALNAAADEKHNFNGLSFTNLTNLIATIIYNEAGIDYLKFGDEKSLIAIADTIDNRAGGIADNYAKEIMRDSQYFSSKHVLGGIKNSNYKMWLPGTYKIPGAWELANKIAVDLLKSRLHGTERVYKNVIGDRNMIANKKLDAKSALEKWGNDCDLVIHNHTFGYQSDQDGYKKYKTQKPTTLTHASRSGKKNISTQKANKEYVVKKGDSLYKIARINKVNVKDILNKNSNLKKTSILKPGQKIYI